MRVVIQRVNHAQVDIDGKTVGKIGKGFFLRKVKHNNKFGFIFCLNFNLNIF